VIAALVVASTASAQTCEEGRVSVAAHCCWPGQTFSSERARCEGAPECPSTLTAHGEACIARAAVVGGVPSAPTGPTISTGEPIRYVTGGSASLPDGYGVSVANWPATVEQAPHHVARTRGEDELLIASALSVFDAGWVLGWIVGWLELGINGCGGFGFGFGTVNCNSWPLAFIPIAGGLASGLANFNGSSGRSNITWGFVFGIPSVIMQVAGLVGAIVAFSNSTDEVSFTVGDPHDVSLSFVPSAPGSEAGASLDLRF
jgi:hypothetical protein